MSSKLKLSPQEHRVLLCLEAHRVTDNIPVSVEKLYRAAKLTDVKKLPAHRRMQQHVGVIIARLNVKRKKFVVRPGGKDAPRTYVLRRR